MRTEYPARVDPWLAGVLIGVPLILITVGIFALFTSVGAGVYTILSGLVIGGVITALWPTRVYTLTDDALTVETPAVVETAVPVAMPAVIETVGAVAAQS